MYKQLYKFLNKSNIFYNKQYGSRTNHSCEQAIQDLCGHLLNSKDDGLKSTVIFLDLSKAFNTLAHDLLFKKLDLCGVRGISNQWFKSYLSKWSLQVKCKTLSSNTQEISNPYPITFGTAKGSCLGPLLFNIFCNDIHKNIQYSNPILFADDTTLYASHHNTNYLNFML